MNFFKNRIVIGIFCLALALIVGFVAVPVINNLTSQTIEVVRVKQDVGMGVQLTEEMLEVVEVGKINLPENTALKTSDVVGLYATTDMKTSDMITGAKVTDKLTLPENKIRQMKSNERLVTIKISGTVLDRLLPNDVVGIYTYNKNGECVVVPELENISVVSMSTSEGVHILYSEQKASDGSSLVAERITFILNDVQARRLLTLSKSNNFSILLACRSDNEEEIKTRLNKQAQYFEKSSSKTSSTSSNTTSNTSSNTNSTNVSTSSSPSANQIINSSDTANQILNNQDDNLE